jgi:hypothetical protein
MSSLLNPITKTKPQLKAERLKLLPIQQFSQLLRTWEQGVSLIWSDENPQAIFTELGASGGELIQLSIATAAFLEGLKAGCTAEALALVKAFTVAEDGTVTVTPEE